MTEAQLDSFARAVDILREHFEGSLLIVTDEGDSGTMARLQYHGGLLQAIGLARAGEGKLLEHQSAAIVFRSEEEE